MRDTFSAGVPTEDSKRRKSMLVRFYLYSFFILAACGKTEVAEDRKKGRECIELTKFIIFHAYLTSFLVDQENIE